MKLSLQFFVATLVLFCAVSCKEKKDDREKFFPVLSFLQSQVADIDTSLYSIRKLVYIDSLRIDTLFIHRGNFREEARDFLTIPDISSSKYRDKYTEEKIYDEMLNRVLITYTPVDPEKEVIQRQEVLIKQDPAGDRVTNIIVNSVVNTKDSAVQKRLLWKVGESFQVTIIKQLAGKTETTTTSKVIWNEDEQE
jgi:hypothetical protein